MVAGLLFSLQKRHSTVGGEPVRYGGAGDPGTDDQKVGIHVRVTRKGQIGYRPGIGKLPDGC